MGDEERYRVVVLGAGAVGKTAIMSRFLHGTFSRQHRPTVDELTCRDYNVQGTRVKVDFLDTAGDHSFPAMRRLAISTAHAFILVLALDSSHSFAQVVDIRRQIVDLRSNAAALPCVVVGNKKDCERQVHTDDVMAWLRDQHMPQSTYVECSAKADDNIVSVFQILLKQAKMPEVMQLEPVISRRLSAKEGRTKRDNVTSATPKLGRSRSLMRRTTRPKLRQTTNLTENDCVIA